MKIRNLCSAGLAMLCFYSTTAFAQTNVKTNPQSKVDSVMLELPNNTKMILILDKIENLADLEKVSLDSVVRDLNQQLESAGTIPAKARQAQANLVSLTPPDTAQKKSGDMLILWAGVGTGLIRDKWVPKIAPVATIRIKEKEYSVSYDMNFFFERDENRKYKLYLNSFLDLGFGFKVPGKKDDDVYHRISAGYLINSTGDYFSKNTFRLSYAYPVAKSVIRIIPELYFTDKFKTVFPGISVRF